MMTLKKMNYQLYCMIIIVALLFSTPSVYSQRSGDLLSFQGFEEINDMSARALALGGAYAAQSGELSAIFFNPAGLSKIKNLKISASLSYNNRLWRDNQIWYAGGEYNLIPQYMENLYSPPPQFNGIWSDSLGNPFGLSWDPKDFKNPVMGADPYSSEAADAEKSFDRISLNNMAIAYPIQLFEKSFVIAAAYNANLNPFDYDWNGDHLDPHWGSSTDFALLAPVGGIVRSNWDIYTRERSNGIQSLTGAVSLEIFENIQLGAGITTLFGSTNDRLELKRIGFYQFVQADNNWSFTYDTLSNVTTGESRFSATSFNLGVMISFENLSLGLNLSLPYTIEREWDYKNVTQSNRSRKDTSVVGIDRMKVPLNFTVGLKFMPSKDLNLYADLALKPYSKATFESSSNNNEDPNFPVWVDQYTISAGIEYQLIDELALLFGYRNRTTSFIPYGVAIRDQGFPAESYTIGFSYDVFFGKIDLGYELRVLKYYDTYYSSRNYTLVRSNNLLIGYTISL